MPKFALHIDPPLMNASGSLGFAPHAHGLLELSALGAFITNPISLAPRSPARSPHLLAYPGGFLIHTGYPNPGINRVIRQHRARWGRSPIPVLVHLLCQNPDEVSAMVGRLEGVPDVSGLELGVPPQADGQTARAFAQALAQAAGGEFPVVLRLPLDRATSLADWLNDMDLAAISLGPPHGELPGAQNELVSGRLYGPAIFPQALAAVHELSRAGQRVIAAGGVYKPEQAQAMLAAGAVAVQLDAVLWRGGWPKVESRPKPHNFE